MAQVLRPARTDDHVEIYKFINSINYLHRHLDWRDSLDWLGREPFWLLEQDGQIQAALACPPEPSEVAWVRLFAVATNTFTDRAWKKLFEPALEFLSNLKPTPKITTLALRDWYDNLIQLNKFTHHQDIVVFIFDTEPPVTPRLDDEFILREMLVKDMLDVARIDHMAFEPIWRLSSDDMLYAAKKSSFCTVIEQAGEIVAYQMSSNNNMYAHLARLAVRPDLQGHGLGFALVQNLLDHFINKENIWGVTLNTQSTNQASISLYHKVGFRETGERFPVYIY